MKRNKPRTLEVGIISEGTLRPEDLIPDYLSCLNALRLNRRDRQTVREIARLEALEGYYDGDGETSPDEDLDELANILEEHVPPYCYFGSAEGDGACIGVWIAWDSLREDEYTGEVWVDPGDGTKMPAGARYRKVVTDHGNVTLYSRGGREMWSVV